MLVLKFSDVEEWTQEMRRQQADQPHHVAARVTKTWRRSSQAPVTRVAVVVTCLIGIGRGMLALCHLEHDCGESMTKGDAAFERSEAVLLKAEEVLKAAGFDVRTGGILCVE